MRACTSRRQQSLAFGEQCICNETYILIRMYMHRTRKITELDAFKVKANSSCSCFDKSQTRFSTLYILNITPYIHYMYSYKYIHRAKPHDVSRVTYICFLLANWKQCQSEKSIHPRNWLANERDFVNEVSWTRNGWINKLMHRVYPKFPFHSLSIFPLWVILLLLLRYSCTRVFSRARRGFPRFSSLFVYKRTSVYIFMGDFQGKGRKENESCQISLPSGNGESIYLCVYKFRVNLVWAQSLSTLYKHLREVCKRSLANKRKKDRISCSTVISLLRKSRGVPMERERENDRIMRKRESVARF